MIRKIHKKGIEPDPLRGFLESTLGGKRAVVEYELDPDLRDTEQVPLVEPGGIETFLERVVLPHAPHAWYDPDSVNRSHISGSDQFVTELALRECYLRASSLGVS